MCERVDCNETNNLNDVREVYIWVNWPKNWLRQSCYGYESVYVCVCVMQEDWLNTITIGEMRLDLWYKSPLFFKLDNQSYYEFIHILFQVSQNANQFEQLFSQDVLLFLYSIAVCFNLQVRMQQIEASSSLMNKLFPWPWATISHFSLVPLPS